MHKPVLLVAVIVVSFISGMYTGHTISRKNNEEYYSTIKHNFEQKEKGYRIRLDALSRSAYILELHVDSITARHRDLNRSDSLLKIELKNIRGRFNKLTSSELQERMIEEYNRSK
jgi:hypothetical protein